ncbi:hypothetical protein Pst134EA_032499 [Puccinia striiformis f. sp. tritici]|uniref:uncharacterized protein n=1 Tax=Puccinia striiformis f. sp. tritici TaxID=168172 RepID=UPI002007D29D|nr:uncharacterized protein Pst134EA_032499 [Puccinia striiformis f. sp. tritici]KAH9441745.1 hypothetical protein Pst134EA_032499 [Puccinia striiformis f. sp. tritici]
MPRQWVEDNDVIRNDLKAMTASDAIPILDHHYLTRGIKVERLDSWVLMIDSYAERINKICEAHQPKMGRKSDKAHGAQFEYQHDYGARLRDFERMSQEAHEEIQVRILEATPCCPVCLETFQEPEKASDGQWKWEKPTAASEDVKCVSTLNVPINGFPQTALARVAGQGFRIAMLVVAVRLKNESQPSPRPRAPLSKLFA